MATENSAQGAPRGSFAHSPTGFRRMTPGLLKADRTAERFYRSAGGGRVARAAARRLESGGAEARHFAAPGACGRLAVLLHPAAGLGAGKRGRSYGLRPRCSSRRSASRRSQVKEINRRLIELGLVTMKDSPNGKRYGKRDPKGRIVEAYGFDLSPIAARHAEFVRLAEEGRAERRAMGRLRRRATIARKAITQILETAQEYGLRGRGVADPRPRNQAIWRAR